MNPCTAVVLLPPPQRVARLMAALGCPPPEAGYVLCELAENHDGDHAALLWEEDAKRLAFWACWNDRGTRLAGLAWCGVLDGAGEDACGLYAGHPSAHDWDIVDPTLEALDALWQP
ncbi:hypothetical protein ACIP6P_14240 [Streptomyces sp. NPDC088729]|uniref:hypothetical protein n=1 Tax=Streptomyces sp. NPDC088729 TaxID=3365876 RepID=UPI0038195DA7